MTHLLTTPAELSTYDAWVRSHPYGSLWQSLAWKKYQESLGRDVRIYVYESDEVRKCHTCESRKVTKCDSVIRAKVKEERMLPIASALVVIDRTVGGYSVWEIPRGPLLSEKLKMKSEECRLFLNNIIKDAREQKCVSLYASPISSALFTLHSSLFTSSLRHVHPEATRIINLQQSEVDILAQMHPKGRYNIGRAEKHGVRVRQGSKDDIDIFYELLRSTGARDSFTIAPKPHYECFLSSLDGSFLLIAEHAKKPIAGLLGVMWGNVCIYYYGASSYDHRSLMAPYLLQHEAMLYAKKSGCTSYDLLGIDPPEQCQSEWGMPRQLKLTWRGITDFKRKFGGTVALYPPEQMVVLRPMVKRLIEWKRKVASCLIP